MLMTILARQSSHSEHQYAGHDIHYKPGVEDVIMSEPRRGVNKLNGTGAYTKEDSNNSYYC